MERRHGRLPSSAAAAVPVPRVPVLPQALKALQEELQPLLVQRS